METTDERCAGVIDEGFVDVPFAARFLGVSRSKVYAMMDHGDLGYAKFGRSRRVPRRALLELAERCLVRESWPSEWDSAGGRATRPAPSVTLGASVVAFGATGVMRCLLYPARTQ